MLGVSTRIVRMKPSTINILVWIALTLVVALFGSLAAWHRSSISRHPTSAQATVTHLLPHNHLSFEYSYTVAGETYSGTATAGAANRSLESMKVGDTVPVFYDTQRPATSTVGPPDMEGIQGVGNLIAASAAIPLILMLFLHRLEVLPPWAPFLAVRPPNPDKST